MIRTISLRGDAARGPILPFGFIGEITRVDDTGVRIFHGPWRLTQRGAMRAAELALVRRRYFPTIPR